ncbi:MAG: Xaa-Pro peptidase family protein [Muribaculaceae bacterium]|nr:Xaa-Pro peptidase family protein [Muribaculaceae bacterium]
MIYPFLLPDMKAEFKLRLEKVRNAMAEGDCDALLISSTTNLFYLSGCVFRGYLLVMPEREPVWFMVPPSVAPENAPDVFNIHKPEVIPAWMEQHGYPIPSKPGLEFDDLLYSEVERLKSLFPGREIKNASKIMRQARMVKTEYEIAKIREDGMHQARAYSQVSSCFQPGMTDLELQIEVERILRLEGCLGYLRAAGSRMELNLGSVISGENADVASPYDFAMGGGGVDPSLPVGANGKTIKPGTSVMLDMNGGFNGYQSDMTRTWYLESISEQARKAHECSRAILRELEKIALPGTPISTLYKRAVEMAEAEGLQDYFMGHVNKAKFIGHGIGIELNEQPVVMERNHQPLQKNMTIALEPKFVIPHVGAVGVENTYRVGDNGLENLTVFPEELQEL